MSTKFKGVKLTLGERDLVVPPLNFKSLQEFQSRISTFSGGYDPKSVALVHEVALAALRRNYEDITAEWLGEVLDVGNMLDVMQAVMDAGGMVRKQQELDLAAAGDASPLTGPNSTSI